MNSPSADYPEREARLDELIAAFLEAVEAGHPPDRDAWLAQHPDLADELRAFFANHDRMAEVGDRFRAAGPGKADPAENPTTAPTDKPVDVALGQVRSFGDYELLEEIARGGMGVVYKARQVSLDRIVALKMILAGQLADAEDVARFRREAQTAAALQHPHIVAIHEVGEHDGQHYFSMDYVAGPSLADRLRDGPLPPSQAACYIEAVARAIDYAHGRGVLHRDLKPANILLDEHGQPRVTDFGLARRIDRDQRLTATGAVVGTPSYMPPEQASGRAGRVGPASDVYALGAVLYELVTGIPPFRAVTPLDTLLLVLEAEPVAPRLLNRGIRRDLETIILKCLAKEPAKRYASAAALADDLKAFQEGRPITARRPSIPERVGIWLSRQGRTFKVAAAAVAVAAVALLIVFLIRDWHQQTGLGWVEIATPGPALRAEVLAEDGTTLVVPPFTAPTEQPLALPEGNYRVRLSAPYLLSESFRLSVRRGKAENCTADLSKRRPADPLPSCGVFDFVPRGNGHDVVNAVRDDTLNRYDGTTGRLQWSVTLGADDRPTDAAKAGGDRPTDDRPRSSFFATSWGASEKALLPWPAARLLQPCRDLDGDGVPDLVWVSSPSGKHPFAHRQRGAILLALSGKDGKFLWRFPPEGDPNPRGQAVWFHAPGKGDDVPLILTAPAEVVDARTGRSVGRFPFQQPPSPGPVAVELHDRTVRAVSVPAGRTLWEHALPDEPVWGSFVPARKPVPQNAEEPAPRGEMGWVPAYPGSGYLRGPLAIDFDGDGRREVIVPDEYGAISVLDGVSGAVRWRSTRAVSRPYGGRACLAPRDRPSCGPPDALPAPPGCWSDRTWTAMGAATCSWPTRWPTLRSCPPATPTVVMLRPWEAPTCSSATSIRVGREPSTPMCGCRHCRARRESPCGSPISPFPDFAPAKWGWASPSSYGKRCRAAGRGWSCRATR
jgi:tRNA A-37 threonylcarbamoyl transferase component Bud32